MDTTGASVSEVQPELDACNQYTGKRYSTTTQDKQVYGKSK